MECGIGMPGDWAKGGGCSMILESVRKDWSYKCCRKEDAWLSSLIASGDSPELKFPDVEAMSWAVVDWGLRSSIAV